jgi:hypothetical protein
MKGFPPGKRPPGNFGNRARPEKGGMPLSGAVTRAAGYLLPGLWVYLVGVFARGELSAAVHAAQPYGPSAEMELDFPPAGLAFKLFVIHALLIRRKGGPRLSVPLFADLALCFPCPVFPVCNAHGVPASGAYRPEHLAVTLLVVVLKQHFFFHILILTGFTTLFQGHRPSSRVTDAPPGSQTLLQGHRPSSRVTDPPLGSYPVIGKGLLNPMPSSP